MIPLVIVPPPGAGRPTLAARSAADPARPYHEAGSRLFARAGHVEKLRPTMTQIVLLLAGNRSSYMPRTEMLKTLYLDDPDGGPEYDRIVDVIRTQSRHALGKLGLRIKSRFSYGLRIDVVGLSTADVRPFMSKKTWDARGTCDEPFVHAAAELRRGGMIWYDIAPRVAPDRNPDTIAALVLARYPELRRGRGARASA